MTVQWVENSRRSLHFVPKLPWREHNSIRLGSEELRHLSTSCEHLARRLQAERRGLWPVISDTANQDGVRAAAGGLHGFADSGFTDGVALNCRVVGSLSGDVYTPVYDASVDDAALLALGFTGTQNRRGLFLGPSASFSTGLCRLLLFLNKW